MTRALPLLALLAGCAAPDPSDLFQEIEVITTTSPEETAAPFVAAIESAEVRVDACLPGAQHQAVTDALLDAWDDGLEVRVATDVDAAGEPGIADLLDAGVPVQLADGGIEYFEFQLNAPVSWPSEDTIMSHAFVVTDHEADPELPSRVVAATEVGSDADGWRVILDVRSEDLAQDLWLEQNQVFGGSDATAKTAYDSMAKSITDGRWRYPTSSEVDLELWIGPQERLVKRVIDAVYSAQASVRVVTDDMTSDHLARALQAKASRGFDVQVVVGPDFGTAHAPLSRTLSRDAPDVLKCQVDDLVVPTVVLVDYQRDRLGQRGQARAMMLTHDLYSAARLYRTEEIRNDQLIDGTMLVLDGWDDPAESAHLSALDELWFELLDRAEEL